MTNTFEVYEDKYGHKHKVYPTLQWFDKENELIVGEETIKTLCFSTLIDKIEKTLNVQLDIPLTGAFAITNKEDYGIKKHLIHQMDHSKYFYTITFDNPEIL